MAVKSVLLDEKDSDYYVGESIAQKTSEKLLPFLIFLAIWIIIFVSIIAVKTKNYNKHIKKKDDYFSAALMAAWLLGGRNGGGGFSGGGFGGFGGGGASGGW